MATTITVEMHRGTIDPQGEGSDADYESCRDYVLDAVREAFPGADVRAVGNGGRTCGLDEDGREITADVRAVVQQAFDAWCGRPETDAERVARIARADAATFAEEFPGELLDPASTDWDATAWEMVTTPGGADRDALWSVYSESLYAEVARLVEAQ